MKGSKKRKGKGGGGEGPNPHKESNLQGQGQPVSKQRVKGMYENHNGAANPMEAEGNGSKPKGAANHKVSKGKSEEKAKDRPPFFGFKRLYSYLELAPSDVILFISKNIDDWMKLLESKELTDEKLVVVLQVLGEQLCVDIDVLQKQQENILSACCSPPFISNLEDVVSNIFYKKSLSRRNPRAPPPEFPVDISHKRVLSNIYNICHFVFKVIPKNAITFFQSLIAKSIACSSCYPDIQNKFKELMKQLKFENIRQKFKMHRKHPTFTENDFEMFDLEVPPDDIKDIEVIPTIQELRSPGETFLRPNKAEGAYLNSEHYLDVQFRLLREDFVQPLRNGIQTFLNLKDEDRLNYISGRKRIPSIDLVLYPNVRILKVSKEQGSIVYKLQLPPNFHEGKGAVNWEKSKKLLPQNLVILTKVKYPFSEDSTFFGVVFSRFLPELKEGVVTVKSEGVSPVYDENDDDEFLLFESEVYLEAYRHTLETLKNLRLDLFPMKKFIVDASDQVEAPNYIKGVIEGKLNVKICGAFRSVSLDGEGWPSAQEFGFDENQLQAYKAAVTKEFTIIQGPPGTGKTFLALKVADTFLNNSHLWKGSQGSPITVVCYTNHALDQFLEGLLRNYKGATGQSANIIRIGGRCQSKVLEPYLLGNVRLRLKPKLAANYWNNERTCRWAVSRFEKRREELLKEAAGFTLLQGVVDFTELTCWQDLKTRYPSELWNHLKNLEWFCLDDQERMNAWLSQEVKSGKQYEAPPVSKNVQKKPEPQKQKDISWEDGNVNVEENYDVDELLANRILDSCEDSSESTCLVAPGSRTKWRNQDNDMSLKYVACLSIRECRKSLVTLNNSIANLRHHLSFKEDYAQMEVLHGLNLEAMALRSRVNCLRDLFKRHKMNHLNLPDVTGLLNEIQENIQPVPYDQMKVEKRWALYFAILEEARLLTSELVADVEKELSNAVEELKGLRNYGDYLVLQQCAVIGLTTTGAAKYNQLLKLVKSKIVIVEEAAEVFEAHIVTSITEACEQLILIGDHRQLRPKPTVYELANKYRLNISMFERMLNNNLHCYQLKVQHRMRPEISDLVRGTIYEELYDHEKVTRYPDVIGLGKNVFFLSHTEREKNDIDSSSKSNLHEAKFLATLCCYLILQGYQPQRVTILTMYTGQMFLLKREVGAFKLCNGVRITCVDNFQGEENDIILLSLVRSNAEGVMGFVKVDNRICVSLSRAKHGLYIIGNMDMFQEKSEEWREVKMKLQNNGCFGNELELKCQIHGTLSRVRNASEFQRASPKGGCNLPCGKFLACNHECAMTCHLSDRDHKLYKCNQPCGKQCANELHPCRGICTQKCPLCLSLVERTLKCEHKVMLQCFKDVEAYKCNELVQRTLACGHMVTLECHIKCEDYACKVKMQRELFCGHAKTLECHVDWETFKCKNSVVRDLPCGHSQTAECHRALHEIKCRTLIKTKLKLCKHEAEVYCWMKDGHVACIVDCIAILPCGHQCARKCHLDDDPNHMFYKCGKACLRNCPEGHPYEAQHSCWVTCPPCETQVLRKLPCGHEKTLECHVNIQTYKCQALCRRILPGCGHPCLYLCSEACGACKARVPKLSSCGHEMIVLCGYKALKIDCEEYVPPKNVPVCGHSGMKVPCKFDDASPEALVRFCYEPCDHTFTGECSHKCQGNCHTCHQGRIHRKCWKQCEKQLVCGHRCEAVCSSACYCNKACLMECEHRKCKRRCGEPCTLCNEKCTWSCEHLRCKKRCGQPCSREPCMKMCRKKLEKCGHPCMGYCGEPCPPLCLECDEEELSKLMHNGKDIKDARFVYLPDCKHTVEASYLEKHLQSIGEPSNDGGYWTTKAINCPICEVPIRTCRRFHNLILSQRNIYGAKTRSFKDAYMILKNCIATVSYDHNAKTIFQENHRNVHISLLKIFNVLDPKMPTSSKIDEFILRGLCFITNSLLKVSREISTFSKDGKLSAKSSTDVVGEFRKCFNLMIQRQPLSLQEISDFETELVRINCFMQLMIRRSDPQCNDTVNLNAYQLYVEARKLVNSYLLPLTPERKTEFERLLKELDGILFPPKKDKGAMSESRSLNKKPQLPLPSGSCKKKKKK